MEAVLVGVEEDVFGVEAMGIVERFVEEQEVRFGG
jgi:hypothetical protein